MSNNIIDMLDSSLAESVDMSDLCEDNNIELKEVFPKHRWDA